MEIEEEPLQLIVAELFHRQEFYVLPGKQAIMKLTGLIRGKQVSSECADFFRPFLCFLRTAGKESFKERCSASLSVDRKEAVCPPHFQSSHLTPKVET